ncbi:hypothetical protein AHAS_Ahas02G0179300 [Arachis hypogaea]
MAAAGSHRELRFIEKDVRNCITRKVRNIFEEDDAKEFGKYLVRMKEKNQNLFFKLNLKGDHCIKHSFWADARNRAAFDYFENMVSFDTTYNTNRAIELCMPTTIHRWCIWHIMKKIPRKLNGYKGHIDIEQEMSHVVWNSYTKDAFDRNWNDFLTKYGLGGKKWLSELYEDRHIWIPVYLDHHFWAGMRSTQRSESMHSFFNKFIARNSSLRQFVKEQAEREFDAADFHTVILCATKSAIEAQFQHVYTHEKFREVQAQFRGFTTYEVIEQVSNSTFNKFVVTYDAVSRDVKCHYLLFESRGILCCHSLSILSFERVHNVESKYILERWSKNIKRRHTHIKSSQEFTRILHRAFDKVMADKGEYQERSKGKSLLTHEEATLTNVNDLQSPPRVKTRGPPKNRLGSNLEKKISNVMKKKKKTTPSEVKLTCF